MRNRGLKLRLMPEVAGQGSSGRDLITGTLLPRACAPFIQAGFISRMDGNGPSSLGHPGHTGMGALGCLWFGEGLCVLLFAGDRVSSTMSLAHFAAPPL